MFESRNIHNMLHEHVSHVQSHNVMRRNILCPWTFSKFKWWVRWVKKPFSQNFVPTLPCSPKFSSFTRTYAYTGYNEENLRSKVLYSFGMKLQFLDTSKKESEGHIGHQEESDLFIPFDEIRIPHVSALRWKRRFQLCDSCAVSVMSIYIHMYIYASIATYSYRGDSLT